MIDPKKKYKTRDGREVRIYAVDGGEPDHCVHGAVKNHDGKWYSEDWAKDGVYNLLLDFPNCLDLIEVKEPRKYPKTIWVNFDGDQSFISDQKIPGFQLYQRVDE